MILGAGLRRVWLTVAVAGVLALTACSSGSSGGTPTSTSPSLTADVVPTPVTTAPVASGSAPTPPSSSPAIAIPQLPEAATHPTGPGAEAFFKYFLALYTASYATLDADTLESVSLPTCKFCASAVKDIRAAKASGNRPVGGEVTPVVVQAAPGDPKVGLLINASIRQAASTTYDSNGRVVSSVAALPQTGMDAAVRWVGVRWVVAVVVVK